MPTASVKTDSNGVTDTNDPLLKMQNFVVERLSKLEKRKVSSPCVCTCGLIYKLRSDILIITDTAFLIVVFEIYDKSLLLTILSYSLFS